MKNIKNKAEKTSGSADVKKKKNAVKSEVDSEEEPQEISEMSWPQEDIEKLIYRMEDHIPENDNMAFKLRVEKLPWNEIKFDEYTDKECYQMWLLIRQRMRGYRLLSEVIGDAKTWLANPWMCFNNKKMTKHHPEMPARPLTPYTYYVSEMYPTLKDKNLKNHEVFKEISKMYHNTTEEERKKYVEKAELAKIEYARKLEEFYLKHPDQKKGTAKKKGLQSGKSKKISPYQVYLEEYLKNNASSVGNQKETKKHTLTVVRERWNNLSDAEKLPYCEQATEIANLQFAATADNMDIIPDSLILSKKERKIIQNARDEKNNMPKKPPPNLYALFVKEELTLLKKQGKDTKEWMKTLSNKWSTLSPEEKYVYNQMYIKASEEYKEACKEYFSQMDLSQENDKKKKYTNKDVTTKKTNEKSKKKNAKKKLLEENNLEHEIPSESFEDIGKMNNGHVNSKEFTTSKKKSTDDVSASEESPRKKKKHREEEVVSTSEESSPKKKKHREEIDSTTEESTPKKKKPSEEVVSTSQELSPKKKKDREEDVSTSEETSPKKKKHREEDVSTSEEASQSKTAKVDTSELLQNALDSEPKPPPKSITAYFKKVMKKTLKVKFDSEEGLNTAWENLSKKERKLISKEYEAIKQQYHVDYENFLNTLPPKVLKKYLKLKI